MAGSGSGPEEPTGHAARCRLGVVGGEPNPPKPRKINRLGHQVNPGDRAIRERIGQGPGMATPADAGWLQAGVNWAGLPGTEVASRAPVHALTLPVELK